MFETKKQSAPSGSSHSTFFFLCISSLSSATSLSLARCRKPRGVSSFCVCWIIHLQMNITFTMVPWCTSTPTTLRGFAPVPGTFLSLARFNAKLALDVGTEMKVAAFPLLLLLWDAKICRRFGEIRPVFSRSHHSACFLGGSVSILKCLRRFFWLPRSVSVHDQSFSCSPLTITQRFVMTLCLRRPTFLQLFFFFFF